MFLETLNRVNHHPPIRITQVSFFIYDIEKYILMRNNFRSDGYFMFILFIKQVKMAVVIGSTQNAFVFHPI